jgi:capsular polysaccharide biosynthesis protein
VGGGLDDPNLSSEDIDVSERQTLLYADMVGRQPVLQGVVDSLGLRTTWQQLGSRVHGELVPGNTRLIVITADASSTQEATRIAAAAANQLIARPNVQDPVYEFAVDQLGTLMGKIEAEQRRVASLRNDLRNATPARGALLRRQITGSENDIATWQENWTALFAANTGAPVNRLQVIEQAQASSTPVIPNTTFNVLIATVLGLLLGAAIAYTLEFRTRERARKALGLSRAARALQKNHAPSGDGEPIDQEEAPIRQAPDPVVGSSQPEGS